MSDTLVIHHHDLDGYVAGDIVLLHHPEAVTLSLGYGAPDALPGVEALSRFRRVVSVDYTLPTPTMQWLSDGYDGEAIWIDHHASAIRSAAENGFDRIPGMRSAPGEAPLCGAELAWRYFQRRGIPRMLRLIGDYDTFRNSHEPEFEADVMPFYYATQVHFDREYLPANFRKEGFVLGKTEDYYDEERCETMLSQGRLIRDYVEESYRGMAAESAYVREAWGLRVLCFNCPGHGSVAVKPAFDPARHDAMLRYSYNGKRWNYGILTDQEAKPQVDVAAIAQRYGGGGHRCAAGFCTDVLLPELR